MCLLSNDVYDYNIISQGKTTIPNVDDGEECTLTDVSQRPLYSRRSLERALCDVGHRLACNRLVAGVSRLRTKTRYQPLVLD